MENPFLNLTQIKGPGQGKIIGGVEAKPGPKRGAGLWRKHPFLGALDQLNVLNATTGYYPGGPPGCEPGPGEPSILLPEINQHALKGRLEKQIRMSRHKLCSLLLNPRAHGCGYFLPALGALEWRERNFTTCATW
jgi:hypothetical protein